MVFPLERGNDAVGKNFFSKALIFKPRSYTKSGVFTFLAQLLALMIDLEVISPTALFLSIPDFPDN